MEKWKYLLLFSIAEHHFNETDVNDEDVNSNNSQIVPRISQMAMFAGRRIRKISFCIKSLKPGEIVCFCLLFVCNYLGITGVRNHAPYLLVPWLGVYMVGIISCYIAAFMYFLTVYYEDNMSVDPIVPALTGNLELGTINPNSNTWKSAGSEAVDSYTLLHLYSALLCNK